MIFILFLLLFENTSVNLIFEYNVQDKTTLGSSLCTRQNYAWLQGVY